MATLTELMSHHDNDTEQPKKDNSDSFEVHDNDKKLDDIYLGNPMKKEEFNTIKRYKNAPKRMWACLIISLLIAVSPVAPYMLVLLILVLFGVIYKTIKSSKYDMRSVMQSANFILCIPNIGDGLYEFDTSYFGSMMLIYSIYCSINTTVIPSNPHDVSWQRIVTVSREESGDWTHQEFLWQLFILFIYVIMTLVIVHKTVDSAYHKKMFEEQQTILDRYKETNIHSINDRIVDKLEKLKEDSKWKKRRSEILIEFGVAIALRVFLWVMHAQKLGFQISGFIGYTFAVDTVMIVVVMYTAHSLILYHMYFMHTISQEFTIPISTKQNTVHDVIAWWELRKFYLECIIPTYCIGFPYIMTFALVLSFALIFNFVLYLTWDGYSSGDQAVILVTVISLYFIFLSLKTVTLAVSFHNEQLSHGETINKEQMNFKIKDIRKFEMYEQKMKLKSNIDQNEIEMYERKMNATRELFEFIQKDIIGNSKPLKLLGIKMNNNFMLFLRGVMVTAAVTIVIKLSTH